MKKIKIKRATVKGLVDAEGWLIERHGFQFCVCEAREKGCHKLLKFVIELSSGCSVLAMYSKTYKAIIEQFDDICKRFSKEKFAERIETAKKDFKEYIKTFPVNEPV